MPLSTSHELVTSAAMGNNDEGIYAVHIVNNGASREAVLRGLPEDVEELLMYVTNKDTSMEEQRVAVTNGEARFMLDSVSYISLMTP